ncbi:MAG: hypothetical protein ABI718_01700 [Acidobacteriota bacterium]
MADSLSSYLQQRPEAAALLCTVDLPSTLHTFFPQYDRVFPRPYKIFFADETLAPVTGFPVRDASVLHELDERLGQWIKLETAWQVTRDSSKKQADQALAAYLSHLAQVTENAMLSNLLADYHAIFWLTHSLQLARHFAAVKKSIATMDTQIARSRGDQLRYRIFSRWVVDTRELMSRVAARISNVLEGEEERALHFFRLLQENVLILTEEFVSPDLRELRSFVTGYLNQNYFTFKERLERVRAIANQLLQQDRVFRGGVELFAGNLPDDISTGLLLDRRFQKFAFSHPSIEAELRPEERELIAEISQRVTQFAILHQLRRGIHWMTGEEKGEIVSTDRRQEIRYAKTTRPIDYGHSGVVDPMVYRFGLMYDITSFSETLGNIAKAGTKGELGSYRQMLIFQRRLDGIAARHKLTLEKYLGDGGFYTSRRVIPLLRAASEIQRHYREMRLKGFAFNRGLRIALNYGYYRLLPMRVNPNSSDNKMEFYGPGVVELSRLTTGKSNKEIEEIESFLTSHGYDPRTVQQFFSPLAGLKDRPEGKQYQREFHATVDANGNLRNEGIVASLSLLEELSSEILDESLPLYRLFAPWGTYIAFNPEIDRVAFIGVRLIGTVTLKGLEQLELGEVVPFAKDEYDTELIEEHGSMVALLRQEFHREQELPSIVLPEPPDAGPEAPQRPRVLELVLCSNDGEKATSNGIIIGEWNPTSDEIRNAIRVPRADLEGLLGFKGQMTRQKLEEHKKLLQQIYRKMRQSENLPTLQLDSLRRQTEFTAFLLGERSLDSEVAS